MNLQLYVWDDVEALADYTNGICFALASSVEQAIELCVKEQPDCIGLRKELENTAPKVFSTPIGYALYGIS